MSQFLIISFQIIYFWLFFNFYDIKEWYFSLFALRVYIMCFDVKHFTGKTRS